MIRSQYIIDGKKTLFTLVLSKSAIDHLKCKCDDDIVILQSHFNPLFLTLIKANDGYRITRMPNMKKTYQVNMYHPLRNLKEFDMKDCIYFMKKNSTIKVNLKSVDIV